MVIRVLQIGWIFLRAGSSVTGSQVLSVISSFLSP